MRAFDVRGEPGARIRPAGIKDTGQISDVVSTLSAKYIANEFSVEGRERLLESMTPARINDYLKTNYKYHVAEIDGKIIGVVAVRNNSHLYHLFVTESHQRCGIAKALWATAMEDCLSQGNPGEFSVNSSRYARSFYEQLGFAAQSEPNTIHGVISIPMKFETKTANQSGQTDRQQPGCR